MSEGTFVRIANQLLHCHHCAGTKFRQVEVPKGRSSSDVFPFDFLLDAMFSRDPSVFACSKCGCMQWFANGVDIESPETAEPPEAITCPACRKTIPSRADACPACGWTWHGSESE